MLTLHHWHLDLHVWGISRCTCVHLYWYISLSILEIRLLHLTLIFSIRLLHWKCWSSFPLCLSGLNSSDQNRYTCNYHRIYLPFSGWGLLDSSLPDSSPPKVPVLFLKSSLLSTLSSGSKLAKLCTSIDFPLFSDECWKFSRGDVSLAIANASITTVTSQWPHTKVTDLIAVNISTLDY